MYGANAKLRQRALVVRNCAQPAVVVKELNVATSARQHQMKRNGKRMETYLSVCFEHYHEVYITFLLFFREVVFDD